MASNPSFMVDDTDEDFFDKLVDDDDDAYNPPTLSSKEESSIVDNTDSDDAKAFANLSISDAVHEIEDLGEVGIREEDIKASPSVDNDVKDESTNTTLVSHHLVSSNSFAFDTVDEEPDNGVTGWEEPLDPAAIENHGSEGTAGVKEVQWSSFASDPMENGHNSFESYPDFFNNFGDSTFDQPGKEDTLISSKSNSVANNSLQVKNVDDQAYTTTMEQVTDGQDLNSSQNWENLYPGWKYDANTGQWYQVDEGHNSTEVSNLQQSAQSVTEPVTETFKTESTTSWNPVSQTSDTNQSLSQDNNMGYPSHMVFDPQYPGWYYDMNIQEWRSLDTYNAQSNAVSHDQVNQNGFGASSTTYHGNDHHVYQEQSAQPATTFNVDNHVYEQQPQDYYAGTVSSFNNATQVFTPAVSVSQSFVPNGSFSQPFSQQSEMMNGSMAYGNQSQLSYSQQPVAQSGYHGSTPGRSSAGRPPHALVTFGFGGKLIVMKDSTSLTYGGQGGSISVVKLQEVVTDSTNNGAYVHDYFQTLCQQPYPGPLSNGNVGVKDLTKWIDERITHSSEPSNIDYSQGEVLRLLLSLLKIASQHYGKLRSPFGSDTTLKENDAPEVAVARLFASVKNSSYGGLANSLQHLPSEVQTRETAAEVQTLLVSGKKKEALVRAQEGQLWGPALVLAAQLGDQFYVETVKKMAVGQLVPGSPLRTLCLLIAGQPADVFAAENEVQVNGNGMLDDWEANLAVITSNRTKDDELVLMHLGDCLWKERNNIIAAHICYLVAEANFEAYSDTARLCLIGADHWKNPRTYACPQAIQRTEVYEYSKMLGNSQYSLLPFQPYKVIYAHMLAEVGKVSDSLKYCQAVTKSLKSSGRTPEVEKWKQLVASLEDRIKTHQQGGFSASNKIVGKLLNLFDTTAHRVVGGLPPPVPSPSQFQVQQPTYNKGMSMSASQSTMSPIPSVSMEPTSYNRSVSEPNFGRSPMQEEQDDSSSSDSQTKTSTTTTTTSRFSRFGFGSQIFKKTMGLVLKPSQEKQAKLGETNKFYYDEKLKRWVEEGAEPPAQEAAIAPPPTMATFHNGGGSPDYSLNSALKSESVGIPPPTSNQFSARARTGVQARYVDTFNQGGGNSNSNSNSNISPTNLFQSPPPMKPKTNSSPSFFVPQQPPPDSFQQVDKIPSNQAPSFNSTKFASMNNLSASESMSMSRRTLSWSGSGNDGFSEKQFMTHDSSNDDLQDVQL